MGHFWTNTIWFLILGIITILEVIYVLVKSKNRARTFAFYLTVSGMTFLFEMLLFAFLKAYDYYPMIVNNISGLLIVLFRVVKALYKRIVKADPEPFFKYTAIYIAVFVPHTDLTFQADMGSVIQ